MSYLDADSIRINAPLYCPEVARFVLENAIFRKVALDGDTVALLLEIGRSDRPGWTPPSYDGMMRARVERAGGKLPERRVEPPAPSVEEREVDVSDTDEDEEKTL
jgi:hypothetical protein